MDAGDGEAGRRRRLGALALGSGALGFGAATAALGLWPGAGAALGVGAALGGLLAWAWRAEPEVEVEEIPRALPQLQPEPQPDVGSIIVNIPNDPVQLMRAAMRWALDDGGTLFQAITEAVIAPRRGREIGDLQIIGTPWVDIWPTTGNALAARIKGRWVVPWRKHPLSGQRAEQFMEAGTFWCLVTQPANGGLRILELGISSDFFESIVSWIPIPAGEFLMGSAVRTDVDLWPQQRVSVTAFSLAATPVTVAQYAAVMGRVVEPVEADLPVTDVTWEDAIDFCNTLSRLAGRRPCYERRDGTTFVYNPTDGFRLPFEEEWEYACRAGTTTLYSFGDDENRLGEFAWYAENSSTRAHPVAQKLPNPWGIYDMHGNVWEWVWNAWDNALAPRRDNELAVRGGSFGSLSTGLRSASRHWYRPGYRGWHIGFRCAAAARRQN